jgi:hypothetical protein
VPALRLREVRGRRSGSHHADEVGGRVDGDRAHLQGGVPEGAARARERGRRLGRARRSRPTTGSRRPRPSCAASCVAPRRSASSSSSAPCGRHHRGGDPRGTGIDPWFLDQLRQLLERRPVRGRSPRSDAADSAPMKRQGSPTGSSPASAGETEAEVRARRDASASGPSTRWSTRAPGSSPPRRRTVLVLRHEDDARRRTAQGRHPRLGAQPDRAGRRVRLLLRAAVLALREPGIETIMVNSNPETVSTDFDISDKLYFEPLSFEDVLEVIEHEQPEGVIVQLGGQTPLKLARALEAAGVPSSAPRPTPSTWPRTGSASRPSRGDLGIAQPANGTATSIEQALEIANGSGTRCWCAPRTCSAAGRWRSSTTTRSCTRLLRRRGPRERGPAGARRPLPRGRLRGRRRRDRDGDRCRHRGGDAAHRGGRGPLGRLRVRAAAAIAFPPRRWRRWRRTPSRWRGRWASSA